jgi:spore coat polysaccharide biosynthesis protein SpsF (cytidylyltransferase family)
MKRSRLFRRRKRLAELANVCIAIQARSTSKRFPRKIFERVGDKTLLDSIIDTALSASRYLTPYSYKTGIVMKVAVLVPSGDEAAAYCRRRGVSVIEGDEFDVLSRYHKAAKVFHSDYLVRLTADCPVLPAFIITKAINVAVQNKYDYCSNIDPRFRTAPDGFDVEVISRRAIDWMHENVTDTSHREHVTMAMRTESKPADFTVGAIINYVDLDNLKLSVDTPEDLQRVRDYYQGIEDKVILAEKLLGKRSIYRF